MYNKIKLNKIMIRKKIRPAEMSLVRCREMQAISRGYTDFLSKLVHS